MNYAALLLPPLVTRLSRPGKQTCNKREIDLDLSENGTFAMFDAGTKAKIRQMFVQSDMQCSVRLGAIVRPAPNVGWGPYNRGR